MIPVILPAAISRSTPSTAAVGANGPARNLRRPPNRLVALRNEIAAAELPRSATVRGDLLLQIGGQLLELRGIIVLQDPVAAQ